MRWKTGYGAPVQRVDGRKGRLLVAVTGASNLTGGLTPMP